jgi:hypothetical protein
MSRSAMTILLLMLLSACSTSSLYHRTLEQSNALRVDPILSRDADYVVSLRNVKDIGYDPDDPYTRQEVALSVLREQCPNGAIAGESIINTGSYLLNNPARTYAVRVKC